MIRLFRKIRHQLLSEDKYSTYLLYASGEVLLVVIGIILALQLDSWHDLRKSHELEHEILLQFELDLQTDIEAINVVNSWHDTTIYSCEVLVNHLKNRIPFHDSLKKHFDLWNHILQLYNQHIPSKLKSPV